MRPYKTFLFDFDLTLADSSEGILKCFRLVLDKHGWVLPTDEDIKRTIGKTLEDSFALLTGERQPEQLKRLRKEYSEQAGRYMTPLTRLFPETKEVIGALKKRGAGVGIISTKYRFRIKEFTDLVFDNGEIDLIIGNEDVERPKPSPEGIWKALSILGSKQEETLYIGDSTVDAETAQQAGVDFAAVLHGYTTEDELLPYPHQIIAKDLRFLIEKTANKT